MRQCVKHTFQPGGSEVITADLTKTNKSQTKSPTSCTSKQKGLETAATPTETTKIQSNYIQQEKKADKGSEVSFLSETIWTWIQAGASLHWPRTLQDTSQAAEAFFKRRPITCPALCKPKTALCCRRRLCGGANAAWCQIKLKDTDKSLNFWWSHDFMIWFSDDANWEIRISTAVHDPPCTDNWVAWLK